MTGRDGRIRRKMSMPLLVTVWRGAVSDVWLSAAADVAKAHDASIHLYQVLNDSSLGPGGWIECPRPGDPFDRSPARQCRAIARAILDDLERAGLWCTIPDRAGPRLFGKIMRGPASPRHEAINPPALDCLALDTAPRGPARKAPQALEGGPAPDPERATRRGPVLARPWWSARSGRHRR